MHTTTPRNDFNSATYFLESINFIDKNMAPMTPKAKTATVMAKTSKASAPSRIAKVKTKSASAHKGKAHPQLQSTCV
jgi:hypothetical protein